MVDDEDYDWLNQWKWYAKKRPHTFYAQRCVRSKEKFLTIRMHSLILGQKGGDHRDGNGLNNTRQNLRPCSQMQNNENRGLDKRSTSGFKGVSQNKSDGKWWAYIMHNLNRELLGRFDSRIEAAKAYDAAALEYFGEFARTNKMMGLLP